MAAIKWIILLVSVPAVLSHRIPATLSLEALGLFCNSTSDCPDLVQSKCVDGNCKCNDDGYIFNDFHICIKHYQKKCEEDLQCADLENAFCNTTKLGKVCDCKEGYYYNKPKCTLKKQLGEKCRTGSINECSGDNSHCKEEQCACRLGHLEVDGKCELALNTECEKYEDCRIKNSECLNQKCICKKYYFEFEGQCVAGLHAACKNNGECKSNNTLCNQKEKRCECGSNYVLIPYKGECYQKSHHHQKCEYDEQCSAALEHTICNRSEETAVCECDTDYFFKDGKCNSKKVLGDECTGGSNNECGILNSECENKKCVCREHYFELEGKCAAGLHAECEKNADCVISNSLCENEKCACKKFYFEQEGKCNAGLHATCDKNEDCGIFYSECQSNECKCKKDYFELEGKCAAGLQVTCKKNEDCGISNSDCQNNECTCRKNYFEVDGKCVGHNAECVTIQFIIPNLKINFNF